MFTSCHQRRGTVGARDAITRAAFVVRNHLAMAFVALAIVASPFIAACESDAAAAKEDACLALGLCTKPPPPPVGFEVVCDPSIGSSCDRTNLEQALSVVLEHVSERPGSVVRVWMVGESLGQTLSIGEQTVHVQPNKSERSKSAQRERFVKSASGALLAVASRQLEGTPVRRTPLAEALTKLSLADDRGLRREFVVVTDAREMSAVADFECARLPADDSTFLDRLEQRRLLTPGTLQGIKVHFAFTEGKLISTRGCPVSIEREVRIRALWTAALTAAGAEEVHITSGPPTLVSDEPPLRAEGGAQ